MDNYLQSRTTNQTWISSMKYNPDEFELLDMHIVTTLLFI